MAVRRRKRAQTLYGGTSTKISTFVGRNWHFFQPRSSLFPYGSPKLERPYSPGECENICRKKLARYRIPGCLV